MTHLDPPFTLDRRSFLIAGSAALAITGAPRIAVAQAATDRRFVFVIQRGAADGLGTLAPTGDPAFAPLRGAMAEDFATGAGIGDFFTLHPNMAQVASMHGAGEALFAHAVASPYRERSHFDGQNVLETGGPRAYAVRDGWMNRLLAALPAAEARAMAVSATIPMVLRGAREVASYAPSNLPAASDDLLMRVSALYEGDQQLHGLWTQAMATRQLAGDLGSGNGANGAALGQLTARLLSEEGARIAVVETGGWDTHAGQRARLGNQLRGLDAMLGALRTGLGPAWSRTLVVVATEFGRTAAPNGTGGTDHGTASLAMLLGGAVRGGRVVSDWPGLAPSALHEQRDLKPTANLDALIASATADHFGLDFGRAAPVLFPTGQRIVKIDDIIRV